MNTRRVPATSDLWWAAIIAVAWLCKCWLGLWIADHCESAAAWHYLCADIGPWAEFLGRAQHGIPYIDFPREYPVGIGTLFWGLGALFGARDLATTLRLQVDLALVGDLVCAALLYIAAKPTSRATAGIVAVASLWLPSALVLSPFRYESVVGAVVLLGYLAYRRGRWAWAVGIWSLGITLKWYPVIAIAIQELRALDEPDYWRRRFLRVLVVAAAVQLAINGPYLIGGLLAHGNVDHWIETYTFHANRRLGPDTVLGVFALWLGPSSIEHWASGFSMALAAVVLWTRRNMAFEPKFVLVCASLLVMNRVYSPQFNLWFMPFLLLTLAAQSGARRAWLAVPTLAIDFTTVAIFPFLYAIVVVELGGGLPWGGMAAVGGRFSELFTSAVFIRAFALLALMAGIYRVCGEEQARDAG